MSVSVNLTRLQPASFPDFDPAVDTAGLSPEKTYTVLPGFCDVHVHFREPGFVYKETVLTGSLAAAHGGFTDVCTMPNLNPVPDSVPHLMPQLEAIRRANLIRVHPYGALTVDEKELEPADLEGLAPYVAAFSDDGKGIQDEDMMRHLMLKAKKLGRVIAAHCEDNTLVRGGYIHDGQYAKTHGHPGICSESEWRPVERDLKLARETGCAYHVCHISCAESVELIRRAKAEGVDVTCETAPHYLLMDDRDLEEDGRFRMNPPIRSEKDREALVQGLLDGTVDMIATDHAPHSREEKSGGLSGSLFGVVGLETSFPAMYTGFVRTGLMTLEQLTELMAIRPRRRFGLPLSRTDYSLWDLEACGEVRPESFLSKGQSTPFAGRTVYGKCIRTVCNGQEVYHS